MIGLALVIFLSVAGVVNAESAAVDAAKAELRPLQKVMQQRAGWMKAMNENLAASKFAPIVADADALAAQAKKVGEAAPSPLAKELHFAVAGLAAEVSAAAANADGMAVKAKLGEVKAKCAECHAKIRDRK
jgi:hypothetical protein